MAKCNFCGYDNEDSHSVEEMTEEEHRAARLMQLTPEEFLHHRSGACADQLPDPSKDIRAIFDPKQLSPPDPKWSDYPGNWAGLLWWKGREEGTPDPAQEWVDERKHVNERERIIKEAWDRQDKLLGKWWYRWYIALKRLVRG